MLCRCIASYIYLDSGIRRNDGVLAIFYLPNFETAFLSLFPSFTLNSLIRICSLNMQPQLRHSGMFLAGIQEIWQLDLANRMPGLLNSYYIEMF
jgi:hypothetical protein